MSTAISRLIDGIRFPKQKSMQCKWISVVLGLRDHHQKCLLHNLERRRESESPLMSTGYRLKEGDLSGSPSSSRTFPLLIIWSLWSARDADDFCSFRSLVGQFLESVEMWVSFVVGTSKFGARFRIEINFRVNLE